jgi:hypothetical protein
VPEEQGGYFPSQWPRVGAGFFSINLKAGEYFHIINKLRIASGFINPIQSVY